MTLTAKTVGVFFLVLVFLLGCIIAGMWVFVMQSVLDIERASMQEDLLRASSALDNQLDTLDMSACDWAFWDDTYQYMADFNPQYAASNLGIGSLSNLKLDYMALFDTKGRLVRAMGIDWHSQRLIPKPPAFIAAVEATPILLKADAQHKGCAGMLVMPDGVLQVAARPILRSDQSGAPHGTLIMARKIGPEQVKRLSTLTRLRLSLSTVQALTTGNTKAIFAQMQATKTSVIIQPDSRDAVEGYMLLRDLHGNPALLARVMKKRTAYLQGLHSITFTSISLALACLLAFLIMLDFVQLQVLHRIERLHREMNAIGEGGDLHARVSKTPAGRRPDELDALAHSVNGMLESLETTQRLAAEQVTASAHRFQAMYTTAPDGIAIVTRRTCAIREANDALLRMVGASRDAIIANTLDHWFLSDAETFRHDAAMAMAQGQLFVGEIALRSHTGEQIDTEVRGTPFLAQDDEETMLLFFRDITERKRTERQLARMNECFLHFGADSVANINRLTMLAGEMMVADCALYNRLHDGMLTAVGQWQTPPDFTPSDQPDGHICYDVILRNERQPAVITDLLHSSYAHTDPNVERYQLHTYIGIPVIASDDRISGVLSAIYTHSHLPTEHELKLLSIIGIAIGIEEMRLESEAALLARDSLLHGVAQAASCLLTELDCTTALQYTLSMLGQAAAVDRVYIFENHLSPAGEWLASQRYEWVRDGISAEIDNPELQNMAYRTMLPGWYELLQQGGAIFGPVTQFTAIERAMLEAQGIQSLLVVPISVEGQFWGFIGFDDCHRERDWSQSEISILTAAASNIGMTLQRQYTEQQLREREAFTRAIFDTAQVGLVVVDQETHRITDLNLAAARMAGRDSEDIRGQICHQFICPAEMGQCPMTDLGQTVDNSERLLLQQDGQRLPILKTVVATTLHGRKQLIESFVDISQQKQMEDTLRNASLAAEAASQAKSDFLANMSHEIRTPLNGVVGMSSLLMETPLDERQQRYVRTINYSSELLLDVINDILDFSKIEAGKIEFEAEPFSLRELIDGLAATFSQRAGQKDIELISNIGVDIPTAVIGDKTRIRQVLTNLLGNAIKFTDQGEIIVECKVLSQSESHAEFYCAVKDSGIGIPPDRRDRLFESFSQVDASTTRKYGGTGLGLVISRRLIEMMGGTIGVESTDGEGSTFWFTVRLPVSTTPEFRNATDYQDVLRLLRVLVVDDNSVNRSVLTEQLTHWDITVQSVGNAETAMHTLSTAASANMPFHLAIIDRRMPDIDGVELGHRISSSPALADTTLILMSSIDKDLDSATVRAAGFAAFVMKPLSQSSLLNAIGTALEQQHNESTDTGTTLPDASAEHGTPITATILLAEDNEVNQMVVSEMLHRAGYHCDITANGRACIEALRAGHFDLVLMDCQMPEMDGFQAARLIREAERANGLPGHVPIIALTANAVKGDDARCLAAGMDDYLSKPISPKTLIAMVEKWLRHPSLSPEDTAEPAAALAETPVSVPAAENDAAPVLDFHALLTRCSGSEEFALRIIEKFLDRTPQEIHEIAEALMQSNTDELARLAHRLKGAAATLAAEPLRLQAEELEKLAKGQRLDVAEVHLEGLSREFARLAEFVQLIRN